MSLGVNDVATGGVVTSAGCIDNFFFEDSVRIFGDLVDADVLNTSTCFGVATLDPVFSWF